MQWALRNAAISLSFSRRAELMIVVFRQILAFHLLPLSMAPCLLKCLI